MEKKIKKTNGTKSGSYNSEEKTVIITVVVALVIIGALLVNLVITAAPEEKFSAIYYLDSEKKTENIPRTVVLGENSTFPLWVGVENQNGTTIEYQVRLKMDDGKGQLDYSLAETIQSFDRTLAHGEVWEFQVNMNIEQQGTNRIIFELWYLNGTSLEHEYTGNWVNLSIEAN